MISLKFISITDISYVSEKFLIFSTEISQKHLLSPFLLFLQLFTRLIKQWLLLVFVPVILYLLPLCLTLHILLQNQTYLQKRNPFDSYHYGLVYQSYSYPLFQAVQRGVSIFFCVSFYSIVCQNLHLELPLLLQSYTWQSIKG